MSEILVANPTRTDQHTSDRDAPPSHVHTVRNSCWTELVQSWTEWVHAALTMYDESGGGEPTYTQPTPSRKPPGSALLFTTGGAAAGSCWAASMAVQLQWLSVAHRHGAAALVVGG